MCQENESEHAVRVKVTEGSATTEKLSAICIKLIKQELICCMLCSLREGRAFLVTVYWSHMVDSFLGSLSLQALQPNYIPRRGVL